MKKLFYNARLDAVRIIMKAQLKAENEAAFDTLSEAWHYLQHGKFSPVRPLGGSLTRDIFVGDDKLTWRKDDNAVEYRLNGVLIHRTRNTADAGYPDQSPVAVLAAIRRHAPRLDDLAVAVSLWKARTEEGN